MVDALCAYWLVFFSSLQKAPHAVDFRSPGIDDEHDVFASTDRRHARCSASITTPNGRAADMPPTINAVDVAEGVGIRAAEMDVLSAGAGSTQPRAALDDDEGSKSAVSC